MKRVVVGLDTSCYTTSAAAVTAEGNVIASCRKLLPVPQGQRGLRQSEAVFTHVRQLPGLIEELSAYLTDCEIVAVCASRRPRDEEASYMPVFQAGDAQGRSLAALLRVPCFATTHQRGHVEAAKVDSGVAASRSRPRCRSRSAFRMRCSPRRRPESVWIRCSSMRASARSMRSRSRRPSMHSAALPRENGWSASSRTWESSARRSTVR